MQGDFNQAGQEYEMLAVGNNPRHYQMLSKEGSQFFEELQKHLCVRWGNNYQSSEFKRWSATFDCLRSFLYQASRMTGHAKKLCSVVPAPEQMLAISGVEALADFEALLYFARSALDRLTFAIAKQTYGHECEKFDKLSKILKNYEKKDKRAEHAKKIIDSVVENFKGILIDSPEGKTGLRSLLAHSRSTGESLTHAFIVHTLMDGSVLRFDLEVERIGVLNTSWSLTRTVSFIMLNLVSLYSEFGKTLTSEACEPTWHLNVFAFLPLLITPERTSIFDSASNRL